MICVVSLCRVKLPGHLCQHGFRLQTGISHAQSMMTILEPLSAWRNSSPITSSSASMTGSRVKHVPSTSIQTVNGL